MNIVSTYKNTSFADWKALCEIEFTKIGKRPPFPDLRQLHGWEGGDTPYGWCDFIVRQAEQQKRSAEVKRDNPERKFFMP